MRLTVVHPANQQAFADRLASLLRPVRDLDVVWVATTSKTFQDDLAEVAEEEDPLVLALDQTLLQGNSAPPRVLWGPLLERLESQGASSFGIVQLSTLSLPPLLRKARVTASAREALRWSLQWRGNPPDATTSVEISEALLEQIVDRQGVVSVPDSPLTAEQFARALAPYFEQVQILHIPHQVKALRDAELARIEPAGRTLWILTGATAEAPPGASLLALKPEIEPLEDPIARAAELKPQIPTQAGEPLPFSTYELERLLPLLFPRQWGLAESFARRAGAFFRNNHRVNEAIWLYESLKWQAALQGQTQCVEFCESELYWLRAGGVRKQQLGAADQSSFEF